MNFAYLAEQTFGDRELEAELLALFLAQAGELVPRLPAMAGAERAAAAHLLKGSARAIGAAATAAALDDLETPGSPPPREEERRLAALTRAFAADAAAIRERLAAMG